MRFECLNPRCPNYARVGVQLRQEQLLVDENNYYRCPACESFVRVAPVQRTPESGAPVIAGAGGAMLGGALFGPPGAVIGGLLALILASSGSSTNRGS